MRQYKRIVQAFYQTPWAILPEKLLEIRRFLLMKVDGQDLTREEIEAIAGNGKRSYTQMAGQVAVMQVFGVICQRMSMFEESSGGVSTEAFGVAFDGLVADKLVKSIVMVFDSPGGSVFGLDELAAKIYAGRSQKKIVSLADPMAASAAYYLAAQASEVYVSPSGQVGSIGTLTAHDDLSGMLEQMGVKTTLISAGRYKAEGNPYGPLDDEAKAALQDTVNQYYQMFVAAVARGRGVSKTAVQTGFGQGRMLTAKDAKAAGMVDGIATIDQLLARLGAGPSSGPTSEAWQPDADHLRRKLDVEGQWP